MLHISKVTMLAETKEKGKRKPFSCRFVKKTGQIVEAKEVVCTSVHSVGRTMNLLWPSGEVRKVKIISVIEFNGQEVFV